MNGRLMITAAMAIAFLACGKSSEELFEGNASEPYGTPDSSESSSTASEPNESRGGSSQSVPDVEPRTSNDAGSTETAEAGASQDGGFQATTDGGQEAGSLVPFDAAPDNNSRPNPPTSDVEAARIACIAAINTIRAQSSVRSVVREAQSEACADEQAASDAAERKTGSSVGTCREAAQVACSRRTAGTGDPSAVTCLIDVGAARGLLFGMLTDRSRTKAACGLAPGTDGRIWVVVDLF